MNKAIAHLEKQSKELERKISDLTDKERAQRNAANETGAELEREKELLRDIGEALAHLRRSTITIAVTNEKKRRA